MSKVARTIEYSEEHVINLAKFREKPPTRKTYNTYRKKWYRYVGKNEFCVEDLIDEKISVFFGSLWETLPCSPSQIKLVFVGCSCLNLINYYL